MSANAPAGGVFSELIQGATPKYAFNRGARGDTQQRNTLARIFMRVDASEYDSIFLPSIGDSQVRDHLAKRIAGDPLGPPHGRHDTGYIDFLITQAQSQLTEKFDVSETLADNYVAYFFGQAAPVFSYSGYLINSKQDDQATNFLRLYIALLRGTQLARRQKIASLRYDSYIVSGAMVNLQLSHNAQNELLIPFSFNFLVKKLIISNFTRGWTPTSVGGEFADDPLLVPYDGRPRAESALQDIVARTPPGTVAGPAPDAPVASGLTTAPATNTTDSTALMSGGAGPAPVASGATTDRPETHNPDAPPVNPHERTRHHSSHHTAPPSPPAERTPLTDAQLSGTSHL